MAGSYEGEVGTVVFGIIRFRYYLYGRHFLLHTDCQAIAWLRTTAKLRGKLARWSLVLAEYDFRIKRKKGVDNPHADYLSRQPEPVVAETEQPQPDISTEGFHNCLLSLRTPEVNPWLGKTLALPLMQGML